MKEKSKLNNICSKLSIKEYKKTASKTLEPWQTMHQSYQSYCEDAFAVSKGGVGLFDSEVVQKRIYDVLADQKIFSVQPMSAPVGLVHYLSYKEQKNQDNTPEISITIEQETILPTTVSFSKKMDFPIERLNNRDMGTLPEDLAKEIKEMAFDLAINSTKKNNFITKTNEDFLEDSLLESCKLIHEKVYIRPNGLLVRTEELKSKVQKFADDNEISVEVYDKLSGMDMLLSASEGFLKRGVVLAPYQIPQFSPTFMNSEDFEFVTRFRARTGLKLISPDYYHGIIL